MHLILFLAWAVVLAAAQAEKPTTVIEPRAQALVADLPPSPTPPSPEGAAILPDDHESARVLREEADHALVYARENEESPCNSPRSGSRDQSVLSSIRHRARIAMPERSVFQEDT